jgi:hypothetical protein
MKVKIILIVLIGLAIGANLKADWFSNAWNSVKSGVSSAATTVYEKAVKPAATTVYEKAIVPVHQAVVKPFLEEVVEPTVQKVIKPAYQKVVAPIAEPIIKKVGAPIFEAVVAPAINFVGDKIVDPIYQQTIAKIYDVKGLLKNIVNGARGVAQQLRKGADQLEKAPDQFKPGIEQLEKLPPQLAAGAKKVQDSIATINKALEQVRAQREAVKKQNLAKMGMQTLENNLMDAFSQLETGLLKLATTDAKGQCVSGILCNFMNALLQNKTNIEQTIPKIKNQVNILADKVKGNHPQGTLPTRMRDLAGILDLP